MRQSKNNKTPTATLSTIVAAFIAVCSLPQSTNADFSISPKSETPTVWTMPAELPVEFLAPSAQLGASDESIDVRTVASLALTFPPLEFRPVLRPATIETARPVPAKRSAVSRQIDAHNISPEVSSSRLETDVARMNYDAPSLAPMSFTRFCLRYPEDCKVGPMVFRPRPVTLTKERMAELVKVNREVNRSISPKEDTQGVLAEEWLISPAEGDCKDYAVTKRHELLARGWPSRSLLLAEVVVASGEHHVVLVVRTRENDFVLDNLNWNVRPVSQIGYRWVRAQQANNPKFWSVVSVARVTRTRVAMNAGEVGFEISKR